MSDMDQLTKTIGFFDEYELVSNTHHDTKSITPLHVSIISAISEVIGVNPTETCVNLSSHFSIRSIDNLIDRGDAQDSKVNPIIIFPYSEFERDLLIFAYSCGQIMIYDHENSCVIDEADEDMVAISINCTPE